MSKFETIIDFGSKNIRVSVFDQNSNSIYSSKKEIDNTSEILNLEKSLNILVRDVEKNLSTHIENVVVLYDSAKFYSLDVSIKKVFDQPTYLQEVFDNLIDEANFLISENNFKDQIIHLIINKIIIDDDKKLEKIIQGTKVKSIVLEIKFICISKILLGKVNSIFKKNNLEVTNFYCSSYIKSFYYKKNYNKNFIIFLDIGYERTNTIIFKNNKFEFFHTIPIGGNNVTKDISKILNLDFEYSEKLKKILNYREKKISSNERDENYFKIFNKIAEKSISIELLKQIIEARIDEIIDLSIIQNFFLENQSYQEKPTLVFLGSGSKLLSNSYNFSESNLFSEFIFFDENDSSITKAGFNYHKSVESLHVKLKKKHKKKGFFENFFNIFSK